MGLLCSALLCSALQAMNYGLDHAMSFTKRTQEWKLWLRVVGRWGEGRCRDVTDADNY